MTGAAQANAAPAKWRPPLWLLIAAFVAVLVALPIFGMGAVVALSRSPESLLPSLARNGAEIGIALVLIALAATATAVALWRGLSGPLGELVRRADAVARGAPTFSTEGPHGTREVAALAASFAAVVERLHARTRYLETLSAHLAHEIRSPLTAIRGAAELMRDEPDMDAEARARFLANIEADAERLTTLAARVRELARADMMEASRGSADLHDLSRDLRARHALDVRVSGERAIPLPADTAAMVLGHLAGNAERHRAGVLDLVADGDGLTVRNDGAPLTAEPERAFEPFYTTARGEGGTGLGLAIARAMLASCGASIAVASVDPVAFRIEWPDVGADVDRRADAIEAAPSARL